MNNFEDFINDNLEDIDNLKASKKPKRKSIEEIQAEAEEGGGDHAYMGKLVMTSTPEEIANASVLQTKLIELSYDIQRLPSVKKVAKNSKEYIHNMTLMQDKVMYQENFGNPMTEWDPKIMIYTCTMQGLKYIEGDMIKNYRKEMKMGDLEAAYGSLSVINNNRNWIMHDYVTFLIDLGIAKGEWVNEGS